MSKYTVVAQAAIEVTDATGADQWCTTRYND